MVQQEKKTWWIVAFALLIILIDQALKIWIKTSFHLYDGIYVCDWFQFYFIENKGMAFGMEVGDKIFLTLFRVVASGALIYYLVTLVKKNYSLPFMLSVAAILAGAIGNLIDSVFYGQIFSHSIGQIATIFPKGGGYAPFFYGKVVDMFYFPLVKDAAGECLFFRPVFNFADVAVTVGVVVIVIFFRKELNDSLESKKDKEVQKNEN